MIMTESRQITRQRWAVPGAIQPNAIRNEWRRLHAVITQVIALAMMSLMGISAARASTWNQPAFGVYSSGSSWIGGVPTASSNVFFGATVGTTLAPENVLFVVDGSGGYAWVESGDYTFAFGNPGLAASFKLLVVGEASSTQGLPEEAKLTIGLNPNGYAGTVITNAIHVGNAIDADEAPRPGTLVLTGAGTRLISGSVGVGGGGNNGSLEILDGASLDMTPLSAFSNFEVSSSTRGGIGSPHTAEGSLLVSGAGSVVHVGSGISLGAYGDGTAEVAAGGAITSTGLYFGWGGRLTISGWSQEPVVGTVYESHVDTLEVRFADPNGVITVIPNQLNPIAGNPKAYMVIGDEAAAADPQKHINGGMYLDATGSLTGSGTIIGKLVGGPGAQYSPGNSPGVLHVDGDMDLLSGATLTMEIGGLNPISLYDQLDVTGNLTLAGNVQFRLLNNFLLHAGDTFDFFHVGGAFDSSAATFTWLNKPAGLLYDTTFADGTYSVHVTAVPEPESLLLGLGGVAFIAVGRVRRNRFGRQVLSARVVRRLPQLFCYLCCILLSNTAAVSLAQFPQRTWQQPAFGVWGSSGSWAEGMVPTAGDFVALGYLPTTVLAPNTALVLEDGGALSSTLYSGDYHLRFGNPNLQLYLSRDPNLSDAQMVNVSIGSDRVIAGLTDSASLTVEIAPFGYAGTVHSDYLRIGSVTQADGVLRPASLVIEGQGTTWINRGNVAIGSEKAEGALEIRAGAKFESFNDNSPLSDDVNVGGGVFSGDRAPGNGAILVDGDGSLLSIQQGLRIGLHGQGRVEVINGGQLDVFSLQMGTLNAFPGTATVEVGSASRIDDPALVRVASRILMTSSAENTIDLSGGGTIVVGQATSFGLGRGTMFVGSGGTVQGTGEIIGGLVVQSGGTFVVGNSPGLFEVAGSATFEHGSQLELEIAGLLPSQFDHLDVTGNMLIAGSVNLSFIDGFMPNVGDEFSLFQVDGTLDFEQASFHWLNAPAGLAYQPHFVDGLYYLSITAVPEPSTLCLAAIAGTVLAISSRRRGAHRHLLRRVCRLAGCHRVGAILVAIVVIASSSTGNAALPIWKQPAFGVFDFSSSWDGFVPGPTDVAAFGGSNQTVLAPVRVLFDVDAETAGAWVASGDYTFAFGNTGLTYSVDRVVVGGGTSEFFGGYSYSLPSTLSPTATLKVQVVPFGYAGTIHSSSLDVGASPFANEPIRNGVVELSGEGVVWENHDMVDLDGETFDDADVYIGSTGNRGELRILNGAHMVNGSATYVGGGTYRPWDKGPEVGDGTLTVNGVGSHYEAGSYLGVGTSGYAGSPGFMPRQSTGYVSVAEGGALEVTEGGWTAIGTSFRNSFPGAVAPSSIHIGNDSRAHLGSTVYIYDQDAVIEVAPNTLPNSQDGGKVTVGYVTNPLGGAVVVGPGGLLRGVGTIIGDLVNSGGTVSPGLSPGTLHIDGNYQQGSRGSLILEIAGTLPGQFDQLDVTGNFSLLGTINFSFINGFAPHVGDTFPLFKVGGTFHAGQANFQWLNAPSGFRYESHLIDGNYALQVTAVPEPNALVLAGTALAGLLMLRKSWQCNSLVRHVSGRDYQSQTSH